MVLIMLNTALALTLLYNQRVNQARVCLAVASLNDNIMTKLNASTYDQRTSQQFSQCVGGHFFLVPGF